MAKKVVFMTSGSGFWEEEVEYTFSAGFSLVQKQKNVNDIKNAINNKYPQIRVLEVSTKSNEELGVKLSAFNLKLGDYYVESIFQSSKVFMDGTQYNFLIDRSPKDAKHYIRDNSRGQLKCFRYQSVEYPLFPKSAFYDYIYIRALRNIPEVSNQLKEYDVFTDVEFNPKKSINCQARACAIYSFLLKSGLVDTYLSSFDSFVKIYKNSGVSLV